MIAHGKGPKLGPIFKPLKCSDLKYLGAIGTTRSKILGIDTFSIKTGQSRPEIWPFLTPKFWTNANVQMFSKELVIMTQGQRKMKFYGKIFQGPLSMRTKHFVAHSTSHNNFSMPTFFSAPTINNDRPLSRFHFVQYAQPLLMLSWKSILLQ